MVNEGSFVNGRKQKIFTVSYAPEDAASIRGALFFMTGFGEYVGRYKEGERCGQVLWPHSQAAVDHMLWTSACLRSVHPPG